MGWHYESLLITPEQLPSLLIATAAGNSEAASTVNAVCEWFTSMRSRKRGNGFLCLTCDDEFLASKPPPDDFECAEPDPGPGWLRSRWCHRPWPRPHHSAPCGRPQCPVCELTNHFNK